MSFRNSNVRGSTQHMVETVDHILFIVIFTFISHVSKSIFYTLNLSLYIFLLLALFILTLHLTIHPSISRQTHSTPYTERFVLGTNRQHPITFLPSKNASGICGASSDYRMIHVFVALVKYKLLNK